MAPRKDPAPSKADLFNDALHDPPELHVVLPLFDILLSNDVGIKDVQGEKSLSLMTPDPSL